MQIPQYVRVRGARWRVLDVRAYEDCELVTLTGVSPPYIGVERRFLAPFESIEPIDRRIRPRVVRAERWRNACRHLLADNRPPGGLEAALHARIDLLPHQLEPALAILRGLGSRVLLADEVGLGKTIQAGLVCAELLVRGAIDRVLVLTPAGLRGQWRDELLKRFSIRATTIDAPALRTAASTLPVGLNPWSTQPIAIASIDYVKRPEVLPAVAACSWDLIIVDEAHGVGGDSDRHVAVSILAARAAYVLLLTATPHSGDRRAFASLCELGSLDADPLLVFRRSRNAVQIGVPRRVHITAARPSADERRMHRSLADYTAAVRADRREFHDASWLALSVLHKRALSSAWSLAQSIDRRLASLLPVGASDSAAQLILPLGDPDGERSTDDEAPAWPADLRLSDADHERRLLTELAAHARTAARHETKLAMLRRLLRRARESAVVFTEYRDTLLHISRVLDLPCVVLHGGLTARERAAALAVFASEPRTVLLATDAAGEGLNLHQSCRLVVNVELPWNPMRLEQRIGRVDRIGQTRTVHAFHLVATGTGEPHILRRLTQRVAAAQAEIGAPDPVGIDEELAIARLVIGEALDDRR
jgi:superfamily II DNA or RNA helicase